MSDERHETEGQAEQQAQVAADAAALETPVEGAEPETTEAEGSHRQNLLIAAAVIVALAIPVVYLTVKSSSPKTPSNGTPAAAAAPQADMSALEALVRQAPTEANKINLSRAYIDQHRFNQALPLLNELIAANPKNATAWNNLCVAHMLQQDINLAIDACGKAVAADPSMQLAQNNLKWAVNTRQAIQKEIAADEKTTRSEQVAIRDGLDYLHLGDYEHSIGAFQEALKTNPKSATAANNIGLDYALKGDFVQAAPWFQKAIALDSTMQIAKNNLAWAQSEIARKKNS